MLDYFLLRSIKSELNKNDRKHTFLNFEGIQNVLVLFDIQDWEMVAPVIDDLKRHGKSILPWAIKNRSAAQGEIAASSLPANLRMVDTCKDTDWKRVIRPAILAEFDSLQYDTFLDLSLKPNNYSKSLLVRNRSRFCLGFMKQEEKLYDFTILKEESKTLFETYEQLKIYLSHIQ